MSAGDNVYREKQKTTARYTVSDKTTGYNYSNKSRLAVVKSKERFYMPSSEYRAEIHRFTT